MSGAQWGGRKSRKLLARVLDEYGWKCWLCGGMIRPATRPRDPLGPSADHVIPRSKGGDNSIENLRPAHLSCNSRRQNRASHSVRRVSGNIAGFPGLDSGPIL